MIADRHGLPELDMISLMSVSRNVFIGREPTKGRGILKRFSAETANKVAVEDMMIGDR